MAQPIIWDSGATYFDLQGVQAPKTIIPTEHILGLSILRQLYRRVHKQRKTLILHIGGEHRSGKSQLAVYLGAVLDKTFVDNFEKRVVHNQKTLLEAIEDINEKKIYGACVVIDEAGSTTAALSYQQEMAKSISESVQILGFLRIILIFVSPVRGFVLSSLRQMMHKSFYTKRESDEYTECQMYNLLYNNFAEEPYKAKPRVRLFGSRIIVPSIKFHKPPKWLSDKYEALEQQRKPIMLSALRERSTASEAKEKPAKVDLNKIIETIKLNPVPFLSTNSKPTAIRLSVDRLRGKLNLTTTDAKFVKLEAEALLSKQEPAKTA